MENLENMDLDFIIRECFLGYKFRKANKKLTIADNDISKKLLYLYFSDQDRRDLDYMKTSFINRYIKNECLIEDVHTDFEKQGLKVMYEKSNEMINFDVYSLLDFHKDLYSFAPFPECAGIFRNYDVYLPGTGTEISEWSLIRPRIKELDAPINKLIKNGSKIKSNVSNNPGNIIQYIDECVMIKCKLIKIHPFFDGNGRSIRCFLNKLFECAGIPPVYIKNNEKTEYHIAMNKANCENNYSAIINFYYDKICNSIVELDINERLKETEKQTTLNLKK